MSVQQTSAPQIMSWDRARDILTVLVVPALVWVSSVSTDLSVLSQRVAVVEKAMEKVERGLEAQRQRSIETNERLARVETKIENMTERIDEVKVLLQRLVP
jgi:septal ring factor EnvC (AmiA/AmiB activator)